MSSALRAALSSLVDYRVHGRIRSAASSAVHEYQTAFNGPDGWVLRRFVVGAAQLQNIEAALNCRCVQGEWRLAVRVDLGGLQQAIPLICTYYEQFRRGSAERSVRIEAIETFVSDPAEIAEIGEALPAGFSLNIEFDTAGDLEPYLAAIARVGGRAIIQIGEFTDRLPLSAGLTDALTAAVNHGVPLKLRIAEAPNADRASPTGWNRYIWLVLVASAVRQGIKVATVVGSGPVDTLDFWAGTITCGNLKFTSAELNITRRRVLNALECAALTPFRSGKSTVCDD